MLKYCVERIYIYRTLGGRSGTRYLTHKRGHINVFFFARSACSMAWGAQPRNRITQAHIHGSHPRESGCEAPNRAPLTAANTMTITAHLYAVALVTCVHTLELQHGGRRRSDIGSIDPIAAGQGGQHTVPVRQGTHREQGAQQQRKICRYVYRAKL